MTTEKSLIISTSQIYRYRPESVRDESQNLHCSDNQALIFVSFEKL